MNNLIKNQVAQMWFNMQHMSKGERKELIKWVMSLSPTSGGFAEYYSKFAIAKLIDASECYYNGIGCRSKVKQFEKAGWYTGEELDYKKVINN